MREAVEGNARDARADHDTICDDLLRVLDRATVVHLQPDDVIVLRLDSGEAVHSPEVAARARAAFAPRRVVLLGPGIDLGHADGFVWDLLPR